MTLGSLVAVVAVLFAAPKPPARSMTHQALHDQCLVWAADPTDPWAMAHGITGLGATYLAADGRKASEVMIHDFLQRNPDPVGSPYGFATYAADRTPIEPHPNLIAKTLVMADVPLSTSFSTSWGAPFTLQQLVDSVKRGYRHAPTNDAYWRDVAWTLDVLTHTTPPGGTIVTDAGPLPLDAVMDDALAALESATAELKAGLRKGLPQVEKRKQGIYAHPCGGLHFVQAVLGWASHPEIRKRWGTRVDDQIAILLYRLGSEARQYDAALAKMPQYKLELLTQQVKFYGHFLETTARLKTDVQWRPNAGEQRQIAVAKAYLDATVRSLQEVKAFETMAALKTSKPQVFLDLIGDSCHATHGLDGWQ